MNIADLVAAKKTQRDKDWPMIRSLVEAHYDAHRDSPSEQQVRFWLREGRSPDLLIRIVREHPSLATDVESSRPLLRFAVSGSPAELVKSLAEEQQIEQQHDRQYWEPLRAKLEELRLNRRRKS